MKTVQFFSSIELGIKNGNHNIEQGPAMTDLERDEAKERRKTRLLCYYIAARFALICCIITVVPVATFLIIWYGIYGM